MKFLQLLSVLMISVLWAASAAARDLVVDTVDNASTTRTSLKKALETALAGDVIKFNIPGDGPHYIQTPADGYPLIAADSLTVDGYTQPKSKANTNELGKANVADIRIVLDSRGGGRRVLDYPGFDPSESAILAVLNAKNFTLRGVSVLSVTGGGSLEDPSVYGVALIKAATGAKIQGCWFGVDPAQKTFAAVEGLIPGIAGGSAAVVSFGWQENQIVDYSSGLLVGTDSNGVNDPGEANVICGQLLAIHLETPGVRVAGNYVNYLPNGALLDIERIGIAEDKYIEFFENGKADNNIIGTDGDGKNDAGEGNYIGPVRYDVFMEFWRAATNVVVAGNFIGVGLDGKTNFVTAEGTALLLARKDSTFRVGSNQDGRSDAAEANHFANFAGPMFKFNNNNNEEDSEPVRISFRGNEVIHSFGVVPVNPSQNVTAERLFTGVLALPGTDNVPVLKTNSTPLIVIGTVPAGADGIPAAGARIEVDFYLADPGSLTLTNADFPGGSIQGGTYLGTLAEGGPADLDGAAKSFRFNISSWGLNLEDLKRLTCTSNYRLLTGAIVTSLPADVLGNKAQDAPSSSVSIAATVSDGVVILTITGGKAPFLLRFKPSLADTNWNDIYTTSNRTILLPVVASVGMFQVSDATTKSIKLYWADLSGGAEKPTAIITPATGAGILSVEGTKAFYYVSYQGLKATATASHVHRVDQVNGTGGVAFPLAPVGAFGTSGILQGQATISALDAANVESGKAYFNIHTSVNTGGEIRGDLVKP